MGARFDCEQILKKDAYGQVERGKWYGEQGPVTAIRRVYTRNPALRPMAKFLASNEVKSLQRLSALAATGQVPDLLEVTADYHVRSYIEGEVLYRCAKPLPPELFKHAKSLLKNLRKAGVCHNDLAKEGNWLVSEDGKHPALVDFQLAFCVTNKRNRLFLSLCRDDLRHLLKHKRKYYAVTASEIAVLKKKSLVTRIWMATGKKVYLFVTRGVLGWKDRVGPVERDF
jgi:tRNA A-37 threonylcarbamoyl transferase component Bud32